jgi:hypothetical protein
MMPFAEFVVGVAVIIVVGVAVGVATIHHWFIEEASKPDTSDCRSCTLNPVYTPEGSVNT